MTPIEIEHIKQLAAKPPDEHELVSVRKDHLRELLRAYDKDLSPFLIILLTSGVWLTILSLIAVAGKH